MCVIIAMMIPDISGNMFDVQISFFLWFMDGTDNSYLTSTGPLFFIQKVISNYIK